MRLLAVCLCSLVLLACSESSTSLSEPPSTTATTEPSYPAFASIDPHTHGYFITLEDVETYASSNDLMWRIGVATCENFDAGATVDDELDRVIDLGYEDSSPAIIGAAGSFICDQHEPMLRDWVEANR